MRVSAFLAVLLIFASASLARADTPPFAHREIESDAKRYETYVKENWKPGASTTESLTSAGDQALAGNPMAASQSYAKAVAADKGNARAWLGLARALLAIKPATSQGREGYDLAVNASGAAYLAYQRAQNVPLKAAALSVLATALERRSYWRPALDALKKSLELAEDAGVRATYDRLRAKHGFRMTNYETDAEATAPRVCLEFSERLGAGVDFARFVSVRGKDPQGVSPEGRQLCLEGFAHGETYEIEVRAGLPAETGEVLEKPAKLSVYVADRKPFVRFTGKSYVLPARGQQGIPIVSVNTAKIEVEIYRINDRNLVRTLEDGLFERSYSEYELADIRQSKGTRVFQGELDAASRLNEEVVTAFPVTEAVGKLEPGVYLMAAKAAGSRENAWDPKAVQWFIVSDIGLTAFTGNDGIHGFVRSLSTAEPLAGTTVRLVAKNNEILATEKTGKDGYVHFGAGLARGEGGLAPAVLVAGNDAGEYAFLELAKAAFDLTDRGIKGREAPGPLDAFLYAERGVYRPGETVHLAALVRDASGAAAALPVTLVVERPDGVEYRRFTLPDQGLGGRTVDISLDRGAMTGTWRVKLYADPQAPPLAQTAFLAEDFVPERLDLTLDAAGVVLRPGVPAVIKASGRYLYGPPAAGLAVEGEITVSPSGEDVPGFPGFAFGLHDDPLEPARKSLENLPETDSNGAAQVPVSLPEIPKTARPLRANVILKLREPGGRTIERSASLPVDAGLPRIGIKPLFGAEGPAEGGTAAFEVVALDEAGGRREAHGLAWELVRLETTWQWFRRDGNWNYETVTHKRRVASGTLDVPKDQAARIEAPVSYGRYRLQVASPLPDGPATSVGFSTGWVASTESADSPEVLEVALDKAAYAPGETARLRIASKEGGKALIAVLGGGLRHFEEADIPKGGGEVPLAVGEGWGAGAYVTAFLYRPMDETAKRMPARSIGLAWLGIDQAQRTLGIALGAAAKVRPGETLQVPVKVSGLPAGEEARVTVAAVDVGILNLTRYETPAPEKWFYAQTLPGVEIRDFYGRLIDGMRAERGTWRAGGDASGSVALSGSPPMGEIVSLFSGIVPVAPDGNANVSFPLPQFNGTVRLMAVAWSKDKLGHASQDVLVRDPVALTISAPRFLTLGDEARLNVSVHNVEGAGGAWHFSADQETLSGEDTVSVRLASRTLDLAEGARRSEPVTVKPEGIGTYTYEINVHGPGGLHAVRRLNIEVQPPAGDIRRTSVAALPAKGGKLALSHDLAQDLIPGRTRIGVSVGPQARLDVPGLISVLDRYPYGCAEQTVSRALPLVYLNGVAAKVGLAADDALRSRVQTAIERVRDMQDSSGAFGAWGPSAPDIWLTAYVTDFLTRAKEAGFAVEPRMLRQALDRLQNFTSYAGKDEKASESRAYAYYVLARNGRAQAGELRYWADTNLDGFASALAKAQLGAALAMIGDTARAERAFKAALTDLDAARASGDASLVTAPRQDYGSPLRDAAAVVTLASETGMSKSAVPRLLDVIAKAQFARPRTSTQEQAWMLLAAHAVGEQAAGLALTINGQPHKGAFQQFFLPKDLKGGAVAIINETDGPVDAVVSVVGASLEPEPPAANGFSIERSYFTLDGGRVDLASANGGSAKVEQNSRFAVVLKVKAEEAGGRVLLVDRLPAGFEIENPRLVESGDAKNLAWLGTTTKPEYVSFRDDRFTAAFNFFGTPANGANGGNGEEGENGNGNKGPMSEATVAYIVRAVTPGSFVHPAATVEDMYRPDRYARTASGRLEIPGRD